MDYKEKVIALLNSKELTKEQKEKLKKIFPELRESEDEKIRKELIDYHRSMAAASDDYVHEAWIAWLEKQGEQKHLWTIQDAIDGDVLAFYGEYKGNKMLQVGIIERYVGKHGGCSNTFKIYVGVNWESNLQIGEYMGCSDIRPATKEQRDTLMKAMADAGYTFDFEERKLKKIEPKQVIDYPNNLPKDNWELIHEFVEKLGRIPKEKDELDLLVEYVLKRRKSTLSEEDKDFMYDTLSNLTELKDRYGEGYGNVGKCIDWLKSLKERIGG